MEAHSGQNSGFLAAHLVLRMELSEFTNFCPKAFGSYLPKGRVGVRVMGSFRIGAEVSAHPFKCPLVRG